MMMRTLATVAVVWGAALSMIAGCDTSFDVFGESDAYFSMIGFLDASADTQWVRVEALQDSLIADTKPLDAELVMTRLATGERFQWRDSLFEYERGARAHNLWTDVPVLPLETYRLEVIRFDGATTSATVTLPDTFPTPTLNTFPFSILSLPSSENICAKRLEMTVLNVEEFAALEAVYYVPTSQGGERVHRVSYVSEPVFKGSREVEVTIEWARDLVDLAAQDRVVDVSEILQLRSMEIVVAAAGPGWPDNDLDNETVALPGAVTHVENGFGFIGGVASKLLEVPVGQFRDLSCLQ